MFAQRIVWKRLLFVGIIFCVLGLVLVLAVSSIKGEEAKLGLLTLGMLALGMGIGVLACVFPIYKLEKKIQSPPPPPPPA